MTSPFVDRVEYQVIGRDTNASQVFRNVADAADSAGDSLNDLGSDLDRVNRSIDDTSDRMRELLSSLQDLAATREITVTTNVREVLGSVEDNRQVLDLLNDRFESLTVNVTATVNQLVELNDGITTIDDNRTAVITLGDDVRQLTQNIDATVDSVVSLNDGIQTIDDNRAVIVTVDDDFRSLTQNIDATVDSVVSLNDGIQTIDDNRAVIVTVDDDFRSLTQNIDATVDSVVSLNDGIQTIDDNRAAVITLGDDVRTLTSDVDATVDSVVRLNDGITTVDDNRAAITTLGDDVRTLTSDVDATVDSVVRLNDGITTVDDNRAAITSIGDDFRTLRTDVDGTAQGITQFGDGIAAVGNNRAAITGVRDDFNNLATDVDRSRVAIGQFGDGIAAVGNNRPAIAGVRDDFNNLATDVDRSRVAIGQFGDGLSGVDDNRPAIAGVRDDFRTTGEGVEASRQVVIRFNDEVARVDDNRAAIAAIRDDFRTTGEGVEASRQVVIRFNDEVARADDDRTPITAVGQWFDDLGTAVDTARTKVVDLNREIGRNPTLGDDNRDIDITRRVVETVSSDRDRWERAGLALGQTVGTGFLVGLSNMITNGITSIPIVGPLLGLIVKGIEALAGGPASSLIIAGLAGVAATAAIVVVNSFTAGVLLALGGGVIAAGFIAAFGDPVYRAEVKGIGKAIGKTFVDAVVESGFAGKMLEALAAVRSEVETLKGPLTDLFRAAGPLIKPLTDGMLGFAREALPGLTGALRNMQPVFDTLGAWLPRLGKTVGDFFQRLSFESPNLARALDNVLKVVNGSIKIIGYVLEGLAKAEPVLEFILFLFGSLFKILWNISATVGIIAAFKALDDAVRILKAGLQGLPDLFGFVGAAIADLIPGASKLADWIDGLLDKMGLLGKVSVDAQPGVDGLGRSFSPLAKAREYVDGVMSSTEQLAGAIDKAREAQQKFIGAFDAESSAYEAMDAANQRVAKGGKDLAAGIDRASAAGRENRGVLSRLASTADAAAQQIIDMGGSAEDAAGVVRDARQKFLDTATAMHIGADKANELADQMGLIPENVYPEVELRDKASAGIKGVDGKLDKLDAYNAVPSVGLDDNATWKIRGVLGALEHLNGKTATVHLTAAGHPIQGGSYQYHGGASGGPVFGPGPKGVDSKLMMLAPGEHILTAAEVDAAGGHQAVYALRRTLLNKAYSPGGAAASTAAGRPTSGMDTRGYASALRHALSGMTLVIDDRTGRTATLIARGG